MRIIDWSSYVCSSDLGTLAFITESKLTLCPLPADSRGLLCIHFNSIDEALRANLIALKHGATACELLDHYILECTKENPGQRQNRSFVLGDPLAILIVESRGRNQADVRRTAEMVETEIHKQEIG